MNIKKNIENGSTNMKKLLVQNNFIEKEDYEILNVEDLGPQGGFWCNNELTKYINDNIIYIKIYIYINNIMNIFIDGDKSAFASKSAILKFKEYVKKNNVFDIVDLQIKYIHYDYKLELSEKTDDYIKFNITLKNNINTNKLNKNKIKNKLNEFKSSRAKLDDSKNDTNNLYNRLKNLNSKIPLPSPEDVKKEPEKYKPILEVLINTLSKKLGDNSNYIKYFKLLNEEIGEVNINTEQLVNINTEQVLNNNNTVISEDNKIDLVENVKGNNIENNDTDTEEEYIIT